MAKHQVEYEGPTEEILYEAFRLIRDAFEFAADSNWSETKRLEFFHSFPFEEMHFKEDVCKFRPILFGCRAFAESLDVDRTPPKSE